MILIPGTTHVVRWTKQNLLDESTYYPRAVIRDTRTDTILDTLDLTSLGNGRFSHDWNVAPDTSGQGREIEVEITVYENSAHTQVSGVYGRWTETYTIFDLATRNMGGGGGGAIIDYWHIAKLVKRALEEVVEGTKPERVDISGVESGLGEVGSRMDDIEGSVSEQIVAALELGDKVDRNSELTEKLLMTIENLTEAIKGAPADFSEAARTAVESVVNAINGSVDRGVTALDAREEKISQTLFDRNDEEITGMIEKFKTVIASTAGGIEEKITAATAELRKPLRVTFKDIEQVPAEKKNPEKKSDPRVDRFN